MYGYSVYDIAAKTTFSYAPMHSWTRGETFIGTDIDYNPRNDILTVNGCYWACPCETFLLRITDPMQPFSAYLSLQHLLDEDYEKYEDITLARREGSDLILKCCDIQAKPYHDIEIRLREQDYIPFLHN